MRHPGRKVIGWKLCAAATVTGGALAAAGPAQAQTKAELAAAQMWFDEGLSLESSGKWGDALDRFKRVIAVKRTPQGQFHVGLCESRTGALADALIDLQRAVDMGREAQLPKVVSAADGELHDLRPRVPTLTVVVKGAPAHVKLDGAELARETLGAPMPVNLGAHEVAAEYDTGEAKQSLQAAEAARLQVALEPPAGEARQAPAKPPPEPRPVPPPEPPPNPETPAPSRVLPWTFVGVGAASLVGAGVFFFLQRKAISQLDTDCKLGPSGNACPSSDQGTIDGGKTDTVLALVLAGVGIVGVGVGGTMLFLSPTAAPHAGGLSAGGRF
jgi:hypothetical protein